MLTVFELQQEIENTLKAGGCETPAFDAVCLLEDIGGIGRGRVPLSHTHAISDDAQAAVREAAIKRASGYPLQYLLGNWDFLGLTLKVGPGVLIPRPETELLCEIAASYLKTMPHKHVLDLCAGSGCVGLGIASLCPSVSVTALELSDDVLPYLQQNIQNYSDLSVQAVQADILKQAYRFPDKVDAIVSNPPYIPTADLAELQREVKHEPLMALDGEEDGYLFYRAIAQDWLPKIAEEGFVAVEVGIGQADTVASLFKDNGFIHTEIHRDFADIPRVVVARRHK